MKRSTHSRPQYHLGYYRFRGLRCWLGWTFTTTANGGAKRRSYWSPERAWISGWLKCFPSLRGSIPYLFGRAGIAAQLATRTPKDHKYLRMSTIIANNNHIQISSKKVISFFMLYNMVGALISAIFGQKKVRSGSN